MCRAARPLPAADHSGRVDTHIHRRGEGGGADLQAGVHGFVSRFAWAVLLVASTPWTAAAGEDSRPPLTLAEARRLALERGWPLRAARADVEAAEAQRIAAGAFPNPQLSTSVEKLRTGSAPPGTPSSRDTTAALSQLVELGGKRGDRLRSAAAEAAASGERVGFTRTRLDADVVKAYAAALAARETVRIERLSAASLTRSAQIAEDRFKAGEISDAEREQVGIAAGRFAADVRTAEAAAVQALVALQLLLGTPRPDGGIELADDLDRLSTLVATAAPAPGAAATAGGVADRPDVRAAVNEVDRAEADLSLQKALRVPDPTLLAQYESELPDHPHTVGFAVSLPVPLFYRNRGGIRAAETARDSARRDLEQAQARVWAEVTTTRAAWDAALDRRLRVHGDLLPRAEKVGEMVAFAYRNGAASLLELLEAERNLNELRLAAVGTDAEAVAAAADLAAARGELLP
jgi:outer membrane protein, heavy metal efflux system